MLDTIERVNGAINDFIWGAPMIILLLGTGIYFSIRLGFPQITKIKAIFKNVKEKIFIKKEKEETKKEKKNKKEKKKDKKKGELSSFQAALVALGGIVGSGNIAGVATAIASGGPGALFWMWIAAFFGMTIKFAEITLGILFRKKDDDGTYSSGPMYYLRDGVKSKFLAALYALFAVLSYIVIVAMVDTNTIVEAIRAKFSISPLVIGIALAVVVGIIIFGGVKRIGKFSQVIVPFMGIFYILIGLVVIVLNIEAVPNAFLTIFKSAFTPQAAFGGFAGASIAQIIRYGLARGMYSNEAGMGSAAITHGPAQVEHPVEQALWAPVEVFIDTIIVCTISGLIIVISGVWTNGASGAKLMIEAFDKVFPGNIGGYLIMIASFLFSFTCLTSSGYSCEECSQYLFGEKSKYLMRILWIIFIIIGATTKLSLVWDLADTVNGFMAIPNLIGILILSNLVVKQKKDYFKENKETKKQLEK